MNTSLHEAVKRLLKRVFERTSLDLKGVSWRFDSGSASAVIVDRISCCSEGLLDLGLKVIERTRHTTLPPYVIDRGAPEWAARWPGEHYRLLIAIVEELEPKKAVEIGTFTGLGTLAITHALPVGGDLTTFDVVPWNRINEAQSGPLRERSCLRMEDFAGGRLRQVIANLEDPGIALEHASLLRESEFIFIDGPKDGVFERKLLDNFAQVGLRDGTILMFDDIRLFNMVDIWHQIRHPKLDLTGFGHFTGTGLVQWRA